MSEHIIITGGPEDATLANKKIDERHKALIFKNFAPFIECTSKTNNTQIDYVKDLDVGMLMYNLIEYSDDYSKNIRKFMAML